jgi:hypothetical protein
MKAAFKKQANTNRDDKFSIQLEKEKKPHSSVFKSKMNEEFLK